MPVAFHSINPSCLNVCASLRHCLPLQTWDEAKKKAHDQWKAGRGTAEQVGFVTACCHPFLPAAEHM